MNNRKELYRTFQKIWEKRTGGFENAFKASELFIQAERQFYSLFEKECQSGLTHNELARALGIKNANASRTLLSELKTAYNKPESAFKEIRDKAYSRQKCLDRQWFKSNGTTAQNTRNQSWFTPIPIYELSRQIMGSIDLDPATEDDAIKMGNTATRYFTREDDAFSMDWGACGNVFMNPPFTCKVKGKERSGCLYFGKKLLSSDFKQAIVVTPEDSGTRHGQLFWSVANAVFIQRKRTKFVFKGDKDRKQNPPGPSLIFGIFVDVVKFWLCFRRFGIVVTPYHTPSMLRAEHRERLDELKQWSP